jgi:hypothetical protein
MLGILHGGQVAIMVAIMGRKVAIVGRKRHDGHTMVAIRDSLSPLG